MENQVAECMLSASLVSSRHAKINPVLVIDFANQAYDCDDDRFQEFLNYYKMMGFKEFVFCLPENNVEEVDNLRRQYNNSNVSILLYSEHISNSKWSSISTFLLGIRGESWLVNITYGDYFYYGLKESIHIQAFIEYLELNNFDGVYSVQVDAFDVVNSTSSNAGKGTLNDFVLYTQEGVRVNIDGLYVKESDSFPFFDIIQPSETGSHSKLRIPLYRVSYDLMFDKSDLPQNLYFADIATLLLSRLNISSQNTSHAKTELNNPLDLMKHGLITLTHQYCNWAQEEYKLSAKRQPLFVSPVDFRKNKEISRLRGRYEVCSYSHFLDTFDYYRSVTS